MPELPEVETTKASLSPLLGQTVSDITVYQPKLRWPIPEDLNQLRGYQLMDVARRAKYLILTFVQPYDVNSHQSDNTKQLIVHLGMSGSLQQHARGSDKRKHDHVIIDVTDENGAVSQLHYHDPRRFGAVLWHHDYAQKLFNHLGPEPLSDDFDADYLYHYIQRTLPDNAAKSKTKPITRAIKSVIMEQKVVVGVGNIYATESLFLSAIHPSMPACKLTYEQIDTLVMHIKAILQQSIELGGSTLRDFTVADGKTGYFQQTLYVYGKPNQPCPTCDTPLDNVKINGRASVFCPSCQALSLS